MGSTKTGICHFENVPCLCCLVVASRYCETWAGPLCSISHGIRCTGTRGGGLAEESWTWITLVLADILRTERGQTSYHIDCRITASNTRQYACIGVRKVCVLLSNRSWTGEVNTMYMKLKMKDYLRT